MLATHLPSSHISIYQFCQDSYAIVAAIGPEADPLLLELVGGCSGGSTYSLGIFEMVVMGPPS